MDNTTTQKYWIYVQLRWADYDSGLFIFKDFILSEKVSVNELTVLYDDFIWFLLRRLLRKTLEIANIFISRLPDGLYEFSISDFPVNVYDRKRHTQTSKPFVWKI